MSQSVIIVICLLAVVALILLTKKSSNKALSHLQGRKSQKQRTADSRKLSRHEKKLLTKAKSLTEQKRYLQAARILESIHMERDAITLLEKSGHIHEAAHILLRMRRPNRAGVIYARNSFFTNAAECFIKAGMPLEAAQCARSAGDHKLAAAAFEKVEEFGEAAQSHVAVKAYINAARCYYKAEQIDSAMAAYKKKFQETKDFNYKSLTEEDGAYIIKWLSSGHYDDHIAEAAQARGVLPQIINNLASSTQIKPLANLIKHCDVNDMNSVISKINYEDASANSLAKGLRAAGYDEKAGMVFEQLGMFHDAAESFERINEYDRASYLWGRAGNNERSELAKNKNLEKPKSSRENSQAIDGNFQLQEVEGMALSDANLEISNQAEKKGQELSPFIDSPSEGNNKEEKITPDNHVFSLQDSTPYIDQSDNFAPPAPPELTPPPPPTLNLFSISSDKIVSPLEKFKVSPMFQILLHSIPDKSIQSFD